MMIMKINWISLFISLLIVIISFTAFLYLIRDSELSKGYSLSRYSPTDSSLSNYGICILVDLWLAFSFILGMAYYFKKEKIKQLSDAMFMSFICGLIIGIISVLYFIPIQAYLGSIELSNIISNLLILLLLIIFFLGFVLVNALIGGFISFHITKRLKSK